MNTKQILIGVALIGGAYFLYLRSKTKTTSEEKTSTDVTKSNKESNGIDLTKPSLEMAKPMTKAQAKPKRGIRPNERTRVSAATSSAKAQAAAQSQVGEENAEFAFNGHTF